MSECEGAACELRAEVPRQIRQRRDSGTVHYENANAASGPACKPGTVRITTTYATGKHPYHVIGQNGGDSTAYGWVDAAFVEARNEPGGCNNPPGSFCVCKRFYLRILHTNATTFSKKYKIVSEVFNFVQFGGGDAYFLDAA